MDNRFPYSLHRTILFILFFFSGCSALLYQVGWQRMLFTVYGVDLESITIIVSVFMFGLSLGGLCGGIIADKMWFSLLLLYMFIEMSIAIFGFLSPEIIGYVSNVFIANNRIVTMLMSFLILGLPTILMGATFPILVTYVNQFDQNVGRCVGDLYFVNTVGGATGAFFSGFILLNYMDLAGVVNCAACINLCVAVTALLFFWR